MDINKQRYDELLYLWGEETNDPETQEWREDLTIQEARLVASWDKAFNLGVKSLCQQIITAETQLATRWHNPEFHA